MLPNCLKIESGVLGLAAEMPAGTEFAKMTQAGRLLQVAGQENVRFGL
jgi:hypothetical protein